MLRSITRMYGDKLGATDGVVGHVKDVYVDDQRWVVRYLVADIGSWITGRLVLISPHAFDRLYQGGNMMLVNLTLKQIEDSPSIDLHKPVSRQYEEEYLRYYGWPFYWQGDALWGRAPVPMLAQRPIEVATEVTDPTAGRPLPADGAHDPHLRSTVAITGYAVIATDGPVGQVVDFLMDDTDWSIRQLVIDTGFWLSGKRVLIAPDTIGSISWNASTVHVRLTRDQLLTAPAYIQA